MKERKNHELLYIGDDNIRRIAFKRGQICNCLKENGLIKGQLREELKWSLRLNIDGNVMVHYMEVYAYCTHAVS